MVKIYGPVLRLINKLLSITCSSTLEYLIAPDSPPQCLDGSWNPLLVNHEVSVNAIKNKVTSGLHK